MVEIKKADVAELLSRTLEPEIEISEFKAALLLALSLVLAIKVALLVA